MSEQRQDIGDLIDGWIAHDEPSRADEQIEEVVVGGGYDIDFAQSFDDFFCRKQFPIVEDRDGEFV